MIVWRSWESLSCVTLLWTYRLGVSTTLREKTSERRRRYVHGRTTQALFPDSLHIASNGGDWEHNYIHSEHSYVIHDNTHTCRKPLCTGSSPQRERGRLTTQWMPTSEMPYACLNQRHQRSAYFTIIMSSCLQSSCHHVYSHHVIMFTIIMSFIICGWLLLLAHKNFRTNYW